VGIRVVRTLGWALTDVRVDDRGRIEDPRVNRASPVLNHEVRDALGSYLGWLAASGHHDARFERHALADRANRADPRNGRPRPDPERCVVHDAEYGLPHVLLVRPAGLDDWERRDNILDWVDETWARPAATGTAAQEPRVDVLPSAPHPWSGLHLDLATGERCGQDVLHWVRARNDDRLAKADQVRPGSARRVLDAAAQEAGFADHDDAAARVVPYVPPDVRHLAEWAGLFTGPDVWRELRPALYTRWS
jgi:hypothetical protein